MALAHNMGGKLMELKEQLQRVNQRFSLINFSKWN